MRNLSKSLFPKRYVPGLGAALLLIGMAAAAVDDPVPAAAYPPLHTAALLENAEGAPVTIVCLGDSITGVYYHTGGCRAYSEMLEVALHRIYPRKALRVINAGISGNTTIDALARLDADVLEHRPNLVTVMLGMNDVTRVPIETYEANMKTIIQRCRDQGAEVILCTPNAVVETESRPNERLREYSQVVRQLARENGLALADTERAYQSVRDASEWDFLLLMSDEIHPNMDGHKLFAETIAETLTRKRVALADEGPPQPGFPKTLARLDAKQPVRVLAMPPYDALIGPALQAYEASAAVEVQPWAVEGKSLAEIETMAKDVRAKTLDLVIIAVPATATADSDESFKRAFAWVMNWSLSFGHQEWDCAVFAPSYADPNLDTAAQARDALAQRLIHAQDVQTAVRTPGDTTPVTALFAQWLRARLETDRKTIAAAPVAYAIQRDIVLKHWDGREDWAQTWAGAIPNPADPNQPAVVLTMQKEFLFSDDYYSGLHSMRTDDLGKTWSEPAAHPELDWRNEPNDITLGGCDYVSGWHAPTKKLLLTGHTVRYADGKLIASPMPRATAYTAYDPAANTWLPWRELDMPDKEKFFCSGSGMCQRVSLPDGTLLLPTYYKPKSDADKPYYSVTVMKCGFDGTALTYLEHGDELHLEMLRGLCEPSLCLFQGRYYLTLRNDEKGYVTESEDGLHFAPMKPWTFDDGSDLGSYNTMQHWVTHGKGLFLVYTRRGADNDHVIRNRAPLFIAQVDPERLCVIRTTERIAVPDRGASLGNFGVAPITDQETWITVNECMYKPECAERGSEGAVFAARIRWATPAN